LQPTPSTTKAIHGKNNETKLGNTVKETSGGHGLDIVVAVAAWWNHQKGSALCSIFNWGLGPARSALRLIVYDRFVKFD
jgi:hypothetical protein